MARIVNLNRFRKDRERSLKEVRAAENRVRFGRSKEERGRDAAERDKARKKHEGKRLD
jgi:hypothetical protein